MILPKEFPYDMPNSEDDVAKPCASKLLLYRDGVGLSVRCILGEHHISSATTDMHRAEYLEIGETWPKEIRWYVQ